MERLGPARDGELLRWEAVINGRGIGGGYDSGRWLLEITIPTTYPLHPPAVRFVTPVMCMTELLEWSGGFDFFFFPSYRRSRGVTRGDYHATYVFLVSPSELARFFFFFLCRRGAPLP